LSSSRLAAITFSSSADGVSSLTTTAGAATWLSGGESFSGEGQTAQPARDTAMTNSQQQRRAEIGIKLALNAAAGA